MRVFARDPKHILDFLNRYEDISYRTAYKMLKPWIKEGLLTNTGKTWPQPVKNKSTESIVVPENWGFYDTNEV